MEELGCYYGFALYSRALPRTETTSELSFEGLRDRVIVFVDGVLAGTSYRADGAPSVALPAHRKGAKLQLLLENMGRISAHVGMETASKGILGGVRVDDKLLLGGWTSQCLPFGRQQIAAVPFAPDQGNTSRHAPPLFRGTLNVTGVPADTFIWMHQWGKGVVWINGFNLGRYWQVREATLSL